MPRKSTKSQAGSSKNNPLKLKTAKKPDPNVHVFGNGVVCDTDTRGHATPNGRGLLELVFDASEGFIPLWAKGSTLRWRFQEHSFSSFESPAAAKTAVRKLLGKALLAWGDAAPIKFAERNDAWDFEIVMRGSDRCDVNGCVLASAFFPDSGRHELRLYPKLLEQPEQEQVETLCHEIGHTFGLRHFFANISENDWPSVIVGVHKKFTIMNYGADSRLTGADRTDLKKLYQSVWTGHVTEINNTPVRLVKPFHTAGAPPDTMQVQANLQPQVAATPAIPT
jgi:Metallo-peptidase family M12B Reprolysin-like